MVQYLFLAIFSFSTFANDCSPIDLRKTKKLTSEVRNQGKIAWCYAHTAADLVQYHFSSPALSASGIAINYSSHLAAKLVHSLMSITTIFNTKPILFMEPQTGFIKFSLEQSFKQGFCPRKVMPDEKILKTNLITGISEKIDYGTAMFDILKNIQPAAKNGITEFQSIYEFPGLAFDELLNILKNNKRQKVFDAIADHLCEKDRLIYAKPQIIQVVRNPELMNIIDQQLDEKNIVAIDYNAGLLKDKNKASLAPSNLHTSSIVGRRWSEKLNSCEYLIRNSFGSECKKYDKSYTCDKGNIWIPKEYLQKVILMTTYLK